MEKSRYNWTLVIKDIALKVLMNSTIKLIKEAFVDAFCGTKEGMFKKNYVIFHRSIDLSTIMKYCIFLQFLESTIGIIFPQ